MKFLLNLFFFLSFASVSLSQTMTSTISNSGLQSWVTRPVSTADMFPDEAFQRKINNDFEGSKYLYDIWEMPARIVTVKDRELRLNNLNFNLKDNRFETETLGDSLFIFHNDKIKYVETLEAVFIKLTNPKTNNKEFFEELINSERISLYKHPELNIRKGALNPLTQEQSPDIYSTAYSYYYTKSNSQLIELELKKKYILKAFSDNKNDISNYVKKNKLGFNTEEDLIKILTYYNSL